MKERAPYDTTRVQIVYNLLQTLLSLWIWLKTARFWLTGRYNWLCQPVDYSGAPIANCDKILSLTGGLCIFQIPMMECLHWT